MPPRRTLLASAFAAASIAPAAAIALGAALAAVASSGCLAESPRAPEAPDWKRPRAASADISDASLGEGSRSRPDRFGDPFWASCYRSFSPSEDPVSDLDRLGMLCGAPRGYGAAAPVHVGRQKAEEPAERLTFRARKGRCYRFFAVGDGAVRDLDVAVIAPDGRLVAADLSKDAWSVVPPRGPFCPDEEGPFAVDVSVADGEGAYALGVWGSDN